VPAAGATPPLPLFKGTVKRATRFVTSGLAPEAVLSLITRAVAANPNPLPPPFSSIKQTVKVDARRYAAAIYNGGACAASVKVFLLPSAATGGAAGSGGVGSGDGGGDGCSSAHLAAVASPLLRGAANPSAAAGGGDGPHYLVEFSKGPASDVFSHKTLFRRVKAGIQAALAADRA
jgi:hypothetical protein